MANKKKNTTLAAEENKTVQTEAESNIKKEDSHIAKDGFTIKRILKVTKPLIKGDDVKALQKALIARGFHCGENYASGVCSCQ